MMNHLKVLVAALALVAVPAATHGQIARGGFVAVGTHGSDVDALNARLTANGYPAFDGEFLSFSGGYNWWTEKLVWSIDGHGLFQPSKSNDQFETTLTGAYGLVSIGLPIRPSQSLFLYPMLSVGGGGAQLSIQRRVDVSFDELLQNPGRTADVSNAAMLFGPRVGAHVFIKLGERNDAPRGIILGIRGGYLFSAFDAEWLEVDNEAVDGGPEMNFAGPHLMFVIGGWGHRPPRPEPAR